MSFYVYTIHNIINNKIYVGKSKNPQKRWAKHIKIARSEREKEKFYLHRAIAKHGEDNFVFSIVQELCNENEANLAETYWIKLFQTNDPQFGYNRTEGGEGVSGRVVSEETRQKIREAATGKKHTDETLLSMSGDNNHRSKVTWDQVKEIRYRHNSLNDTLVILSKYYCISERTIARIIYNQNWCDKMYTPPLPNKINHNGKPKLTQEKADQIREMCKNGSTFAELSDLFDVTKENISAIANGKIWRNK